METLFGVLGGAVVGLVVSLGLAKWREKLNKKSVEAEVNRLLNRARSEAMKIEKEAKSRAKEFETRARKNLEAELSKQKQSLKSKEQQLENKLKELQQKMKDSEEDFRTKLKSLEARSQSVIESEEKLKMQEKKLQEELEAVRTKISQVSKMSQDEAKAELMRLCEAQAREEASKKVLQIQAEAEKEADQRAKKIIATAVARFASEYTSERTVSVYALDNEEVKGKIIGREGRNIRTLEALCGVDLIVDDTPEAVVISSFDSVRRELARRTIEKLLEDGRVHPARIEEVVEKVKAELNKSIKEEGEKAVAELGLVGLHNELVKAIGSMRYRHAYTQNLLNHSMEVAFLSGLMAQELGLNVKQARRAGLLHDIGKTVDHTVEGSHAVVGADFAKRHGESDAICHVIRAHHGGEPPHSLLAHIVSAANVLSNSRPGARRPGMDNYIQRLSEIESIANSFEGVLRSYALQAGREVRVIVEASRVSDDFAQLLARDISLKIEKEMSHLGAIRVGVVRETRSIEYAR
jgi:ribonuclease Y